MEHAALRAAAKRYSCLCVRCVLCGYPPTAKRAKAVPVAPARMSLTFFLSSRTNGCSRRALAERNLLSLPVTIFSTIWGGFPVSAACVEKPIVQS